MKEFKGNERASAVREDICRGADMLDNSSQVGSLNCQIVAPVCRIVALAATTAVIGNDAIATGELAGDAVKKCAVDARTVHAHQGGRIGRYIRAGILAAGNRGARIFDRKIHVVPPSSMPIQLHVSTVGWTRIALCLVNRLTVPEPRLFMAQHHERREKTKLVKQEPAPCFGADAMLRHNCLEEHMPMSTFLNASPIFGPVRSRRLGLSLGVNMMPASGKICTFDCMYCENGLNAERPCHEPCNTAAVVLDALEAKLREMAAEGELPDVITFAGNGEPTAAPEFPQAIAGAVALRDELAPNTKIAVLSNGTRADRPQVHDALMMVDDNILKLDTVDPAFIQLLDQPVGPYDVEHQIETFASFDGHVIIQTLFLTGEYQGKSIDNTGDEYVGPWLAALERIRPQEATIYTVARETPVAGLAKAAPKALDAIAARVRALGIPCQVSY